MPAQNHVFEHMSAISRLVKNTGDKDLTNQMKQAAGKSHGKNGPVLPDLPAVKQLAGRLPAGYPRDMACARVQACERILVDDIIINTIRIRTKLSALPNSPQRQNALAALDAAMTATQKNDARESVQAVDALDNAIESLSDSDFTGADPLDQAIIQSAAAYMRKVLLSIYGSQNSETKS